MARRRRYDTAGLVDRMRAERRAGIILTLAGVFVIFFLVALYATSMGDSETDKEDPFVDDSTESAQAEGEGSGPAEGETAEGAAEGEGSDATAEAGGDAGEADGGEEEQPEEEPAGPASVQLTLKKKGVVWLGKKKLGKFKKKKIEIPPGTHELRAKVGRKKFKTSVEIKGGEKLVILFDHKKKKITVKKK